MKTKNKNIRYIKCCKCPKTKRNIKKNKTKRLKTKRLKTKRLKTKHNKKLGAAPPELYQNKSIKQQLEYALSLLRESNLNEVVMDIKPHSKIESPLQLGMTSWSNLTYWNGYQILIDNKGHKDDMKNIIYMLKHEPKFKKQNKEEWINHIKRAIFIENYGMKFNIQKYRAPPIKQDLKKKISLKDLTIILLEHRLEIVNWSERHPTPVSKPLRDPRAAEQMDDKPTIPNKLDEPFVDMSAKPTDKPPTPNNWDDEPFVDMSVKPNDKQPTPNNWDDEEPFVGSVDNNELKTLEIE